MDRKQALQIAQEIFPEKNQRQLLDVLFENTMYPAYDPDGDNPANILREELEGYRAFLNESENDRKQLKPQS